MSTLIYRGAVVPLGGSSRVWFDGSTHLNVPTIATYS